MRLVIVGEDLPQLMRLAAAAGRDFGITSLIHTEDVARRAAEFSGDDAAVLVLCDPPGRGPEAYAVARPARTIIVSDDPPSATFAAGAIFLRRAEAVAALKPAIRRLVYSNAETARPPPAPWPRWSRARGHRPAAMTSRSAR